MIKLGVAGTSQKGYQEAFSIIKQNSLSALEVEFTYGVKMQIEEAKKIKELSKKFNVLLSVHAPYYINLSAIEKEKILASRKRILDSCMIAHYLGAKYVVFHAGFYLKRNPKEVFEIIEKEIKILNEEIKKNKWDVVLAPETTGKISQFGELDELILLKQKTGCHFCIDFSHIYARNNGIIDYKKVIDKIKPFKEIHSHFSGIEYGNSGEKKHIRTTKEFITPLIKELIKNELDIVVINESPDPFSDAIMTKKLIQEIKHL
jgi:deoxyribonuclease IV